MMSWLRDLHWELYYDLGYRFLPKPQKREWRILLLPGMEPPPPREGYTQTVVELPNYLTGFTEMQRGGGPI